MGATAYLTCGSATTINISTAPLATHRVVCLVLARCPAVPAPASRTCTCNPPAPAAAHPPPHPYMNLQQRRTFLYLEQRQVHRRARVHRAVVLAVLDAALQVLGRQEAQAALVRRPARVWEQRHRVQHATVAHLRAWT
eukprot:GHRQ01035037.1.p3 GENE.GHRQ01035037.1~~GHRQ01035037.1.p3  ORF type:complete len:138 (-),score=18.87 GHRQ01035037.1:1027-1440(-)